MSSYESVKKSYQKRKQQIIYVMGGKCVCCGYNKCNSALELHHLDPSEKEFAISNRVIKAWEKQKAELPKTVLVCANCHREIHAGIIDGSILKTSYNSDRAEEISDEIFNKTHKKSCYCKRCGVEISYGADHCQTCKAILSRKVERPSREQLKKDLREFSMVKIGEKYGVSDNAVRKWCDKYDLPRKASDIKNFTDDEWQLI